MHIYIKGLSRQPLTEDEVTSFLAAFPGVLGLTPYFEPQIKYFANGWSGIQWIAESHIAIDCVGCKNWIYILSCKSFNATKATRYAMDTLHLYRVQTCFNPEWGEDLPG